jgi:hypothetical protein
MKLEQRGFLACKKFEYDQRTLKVSSWDVVSGSREWSIQLDEISHRYDVRRRGFFSGGCLLVVLIFILSILLALNASWQLTLIAMLVVLIPSLFGRTINLYSYIELNTKRGSIILKQSSPSNKTVIEFVDGLINASKQYLIWKYGTTDPDFSKEKQIENYRWLRNNGIITDQEYENLKATLFAKLRKE